jgi:hypothetical protein
MNLNTGFPFLCIGIIVLCGTKPANSPSSNTAPATGTTVKTLPPEHTTFLLTGFPDTVALVR